MTADAVGGVWQYATELAAALVPHGVETTIAVLGPAPSDGQLAELGAAGTRSSTPANARAQESDGRDARSPVAKRGDLGPGVRRGGAGGAVRVLPTDLPLDWLASGPDPVLAAGRAVADLAREVGADIVHLNSPTLAAAARFDRPVVAVAHGCIATWWRAANGCEPDPAYRWQADLMRRGLLAADAAVAPSASFAADLRATYALPTAPLAVRNGRSRQALGVGTPARHVLTAGRLWDRVKNTDLLDRVAARLSVPLRAAGAVTGPHGETVAPKHLQLLGNLSADRLAAELARTPVFVSAATFEPFGLAVLEAAQAGCALVLSDIPTFRELWDGAALFVPPHDEAAVAAVLEEVLADPIQRSVLGEAAMARAARYTPQATAAAMASLYGGLLGAGRAAA
jgi:glycosyltransferase involved in cell wall biosynthesis